MRIRLSLALLPLLALAACESGGATDVPASDGGSAPPMTLTTSGWEAAEIVRLPAYEPDEWDDLHNVVRLSDTIISGGEPHGEDALRRISEMGVKTILSVDGKAPDAETAARYGMRYVHVPIQYSGLTDEEIAGIAKTFQELPAPFYVHCFHGKHRGPAGAAVGRLVLDGASREQALAEMRQWCGTSKKYEGLYRDIAVKPMPTAEESARHAFDFPSAHPFDGTRKAMIGMARHWDNVVLLAERDWAPDPAHPDLDALNEAEKLHGLLAALTADSGFSEEPDDYREWMLGSLAETDRMVDGIRAARAGDPAAGASARGNVKATKELCNVCHTSYRN